MGLGFSFIALILANYLVTVLRAAIRFLYFSVVTLRDNSQTVTFNVDSLLIQNLFNIKGICYCSYSGRSYLYYWVNSCLEVCLG